MEYRDKEVNNYGFTVCLDPKDGHITAIYAHKELQTILLTHFKADLTCLLEFENVVSDLIRDIEKKGLFDGMQR